MKIKLHTQEYKTNFFLAYPVILSQGGQLLVSLIDNAMIGFVGTLPLAAAAFSNSLFSIFIVLIIGFSYGSTVLIGQAIGAKNIKLAGIMFKNTLLTNFITTGLIVIALICASPLMHEMGQTEHVSTMAVPYFKVTVYSLLPFCFFLTFKSLCEGMALTKIVMNFTLAANVINIILNYIFIYGKLGFPAMGLLGAGYATLIARVAMALGLGIYIFYVKYFKEIVTHFLKNSFSYAKILRITKISIPVSLQFTMEVLAFSFGGIMIGWIGETALAAHQIALGLGAFTYMMATGLGSATVIRVSNAFGKKDYKKMKIAGNSLQEVTIFFMTFWALVFVIFHQFLPTLFIRDQAVIQIAAHLLLIGAIFQIFDGLQTVSLAALRGMGDVKVPTILALIAYWLISIPVGYYTTFTLNMGVTGVWIGYIVGLGTAAFTFMIRFERICKRQLLNYSP